MAFDKGELHLVESHVDRRKWVYDTADSVATVIAAGYITDGLTARCFGMEVGDMVTIRVWADVTTKASLSSVTHHRVTAVGLSTTALGNGAEGDIALVTVGPVIAIGATAEKMGITIPYAFRVKTITTSINKALATGDATVTCSIGAAAITNGVVTITQSGSAAYDVDTATPTAANTGAAGAQLRALIGGTNDAAGSNVVITYSIERIG